MTAKPEPCSARPITSNLEQVIDRLRLNGGSIPQGFKQVLRDLDAGRAEGLARAAALLEDMLQLQIVDEGARDYGQLPMRAGSSAGDLNNCVFILPDLIDILGRHGSRLPAPLAKHLDQAARLALVAAQRRWDEELFDLHRDHVAYSNIFLLYIQALLRGGLHYKDARLLRIAAGQWRRWFNHIAYYGIDEFVSPAYTDIDYNALLGIHEHAIDPGMRTEARQVLDHLATLLHAVTHPRLQLSVCGASRDYRRFLPPGPHEPACMATAPSIAGYTPPADVAAAYRQRRFPYQAAGRASTVPFRFQSWQSERAAMGSMTGGNYFWQQIHCMVAVGQDADHRDVAFLPGSYSIAGGYVCQRDNRALCVFGRRPNTLLRTQRLTPDAQLPQAFGELGVGVSAGWTAAQGASGRLTLCAYNHTLTVDPFVVADCQCQPASLVPVKRTNLSQGRFHNTPVEMTEWIFSGDAEWLGCVLQLDDQGTRPAPLIAKVVPSDRIWTFTAGTDLRLRLFLHPSGEVTELYDDDWRTLPLLECPEQVLRPGDLTARALQAR